MLVEKVSKEKLTFCDLAEKASAPRLADSEKRKRIISSI